ncbi:siderophore ferric iron reductase [Roseateles sp. DAIF2]|uniref:siderophore ferric iron reductase n=1 Tax=Roseateles sp. DAIF2 TaxID=2714952 RepID=UPI0018A2838C|nr:siderophore ferric iron reductase [Roseateles sp. DAIF2]QPF72391.1 siderophore ferric iron reductase [Roseateles sp. DAIF2]
MSALAAPQRPAPDADLARLFGLTERLLPALRGEQGVGANGAALPEPAALDALCRHWRESYPEAGAHYWALRCWGLLIWQPIYLCVIAAQLDERVPRLAGLRQPLQGGFPRGLSLPAHRPPRGRTLDERIALAGDELRPLCAEGRTLLAPRVALHRAAAERLQAECVLGALLLVHEQRPQDLTLEALPVLAQRWLARLDIAGGCGLLAYRARDGTPRVALDRKVCCHHYRRHDGEKCSTCPLLPRPARLERLLAETD